jgi:hypothetical protein
VINGGLPDGAGSLAHTNLHNTKVTTHHVWGSTCLDYSCSHPWITPAHMLGLLLLTCSRNLAHPCPQAISSFFVSRVRSCLHLVLCFSPVGDAFRQRLRMFPSLVGDELCTGTAALFLPWLIAARSGPCEVQLLQQVHAACAASRLQRTVVHCEPLLSLTSCCSHQPHPPCLTLITTLLHHHDPLYTRRSTAAPSTGSASGPRRPFPPWPAATWLRWSSVMGRRGRTARCWRAWSAAVC